MCGIVGYAGQRNALPILLDGLKRLEYRGYDSAGVAIVGSGLQVVKDKGGKTQDAEGEPGQSSRACTSFLPMVPNK